MTGILGGAFDPPHVGHVALAESAQRELGLDELVVVVVADPGHKDVHTAAEARLALTRAAFPDRRVELDHHARTVDMLRAGLWDDPVLVIGADEYLDFQNWKEPETVLELARLGVAARPGFPLPERPGHRVLQFDFDPMPISSSEIRERVARGEPIDGLVPPTVAETIARLGLYRG